MRKSIFKKENIILLESAKQTNHCSKLYKKERKRFFNGLNPSFVTDNKIFRKTVRPFSSDKGNYGANITLVEKEVFQNDGEITKNLNEFFKNEVSTLGITENP